MSRPGPSASPDPAGDGRGALRDAFEGWLLTDPVERADLAPGFREFLESRLADGTGPADLTPAEQSNLDRALRVFDLYFSLPGPERDGETGRALSAQLRAYLETHLHPGPAEPAPAPEPAPLAKEEPAPPAAPEAPAPGPARPLLAETATSSADRAAPPPGDPSAPAAPLWIAAAGALLAAAALAAGTILLRKHGREARERRRREEHRRRRRIFQRGPVSDYRDYIQENDGH